MFSSVSSGNQFKNEASPNATIGNFTGSLKLLVPGRATAVADIPQGATTGPIEPEYLIGNPDVVQILIGMDDDGSLDLQKSSKQVWSNDVHWVRALRLSDDCHSYNVQLKLQSLSKKSLSCSKLILEAIRPIPMGQELLLWFSEDVLALLQMVFLTPANIQGQKRYVCTMCSALYESPNPLKLHLLLRCGRQSISDLWKRLSRLVAEYNKNKSSNSINTFTFKLTPTDNDLKQRNAIDLTTSNSHTEVQRPLSHPSKLTDLKEEKVLYRPYSEPSAAYTSAFKPFQKLTINDTLIKYNKSTSNNLPCWPNFTYQPQFFVPSASTNVAQNEESQMETLVSSLGKSKDGHICLYCGKCYSRKYGLKIHIRTHTGFKPLKCKFCLRPFGDPSNLNKHIRLHAEGDTPYKCELCGKILVRRRDLERHLKSRHMSEMYPDSRIEEKKIV
ncbi:hypothetical protein FQA39_LY15374 [Lamprigera yunnana]|nr:hypothetical protein FQA39_LY15374 [Lamprigera yunnana]